MIGLACSKPDRPSAARKAVVAELAAADTSAVAITGPTVVAYFLVPPGAVDTMPSLAVEADDWSYAMATLRDSLEASRIGLIIAVDPVLRIDSVTSRTVILPLGAPLTAGYVFVRRGEKPCLRPGAADQAVLLLLARQFFSRPVSVAESSSTRCGGPAG